MTRPETTSRYPRVRVRREVAEAADTTDRTPPNFRVRPVHLSRWGRLLDTLRWLRYRVHCARYGRRYPELVGDGFSHVTGEKGLSLDGFRRIYYRKRLGRTIRGKTVLVLGCGYGDELLGWIPHRPKCIIGVDISNYGRAWDRIARTAGRAGVRTRFVQYDLTEPQWSFVEPDSVDIASAYAVLEHVVDLESFLRACRESLRPGGYFEAAYGPLWYGPNGDHLFPLSDEEIYNHLLLDDASYDRFVERTRDYWEHHETGMEGPFLLENGLFSFLKPAEYLDLFRRTGYSVLYSHAALSQRAAGFRQRHPDEWRRMKGQHGLRDVDLLATGCTTLCVADKG